MDLNEKIESYRNDLVRSVQEVVRIKSVGGEPEPGKPFGEGPDKALKKALEIASGMGFKTVDMDGYIGYAEYGTGEEYVAILGHMDVVPEGNGWDYPPYGAEIHDGKIYGRGTLDDKGPIMAALYGLKAIKELNLPLKHRVRVLFGTNEEEGSKEMQYYNEREKPPIWGFTPDGEYPIIYAEKGLTTFDLVKDLNREGDGPVVVESLCGGQRANMVPDRCDAVLQAKDPQKVIEACKAFAKRTGYEIDAELREGKILVTSKGVGAHGSLPHLGKNAIMQLFAFLGELPLGNGDVAHLVEFFNRYIDMETDGKSFGVYLEDEVSGKLSFNVGTAALNEKQARFALNLRYPVTRTFEEMMTPFNKRIEGTGLRVENMEHQKPLYFPPEHPLIKTLQKVYTEQTGQEAALLAIGGGTYAKEMPNIVAFGPIFPGEPDLDHQPNEYISIEDLLKNAKIYAHAIYELAK